MCRKYKEKSLPSDVGLNAELDGWFGWGKKNSSIPISPPVSMAPSFKMVFVRLSKAWFPDKPKNKPKAIKTGMYTKKTMNKVTAIFEETLTMLPTSEKSPK